MVAWLRYLITHFLKPRARAASDPDFVGFTFDHVLGGMVVGCRRDTRELFAVTVRGNRVTERVLRAADPRYLDFGQLAYEAQIDRERAERRRRRRRTAGNVLEFSRSGT